MDIQWIKGQAHAKRAIEVAAAGNHSILLTGIRGVGKSMLLEAMEGLLHGVEDYSQEDKFIVNLAKVDNFDPTDKEMISRLIASLTESVQYYLVLASTTICPCGYYGDNLKACTCSAAEIGAYYHQLNTIMELFPLQIELARVETDTLLSTRRGESSAQVAERITAAVSLQEKRFKQRNYKSNAFMTPEDISTFCELDTAGMSLIKAAINQLGMTPRLYFSTLTVARTIADLAGKEHITAVDLAEAIQYQVRRSINFPYVSNNSLVAEIGGIATEINNLSRIMDQMRIAVEMLEHK